MQDPIQQFKVWFDDALLHRDIVEPIIVRTWITNYGNQPASGFPMSYRFGSNAAVTQTYTGPAVQPAQQVLFSFTQPFDPTETAAGNLCSWSDWTQDLDASNDTICVAVNAFVGLAELNTIAARTWPNPTNDGIQIEGLPEGTWTLQMLDAQGRTAQQEQRTATSAPLHIDMRSMAEGIYLLQATGPAGMFRTAVVVQR